jgi:hypothetical protein
MNWITLRATVNRGDEQAVWDEIAASPLVRKAPFLESGALQFHALDIPGPLVDSLAGKFPKHEIVIRVFDCWGAGFHATISIANGTVEATSEVCDCFDRDPEFEQEGTRHTHADDVQQRSHPEVLRRGAR